MPKVENILEYYPLLSATDSPLQHVPASNRQPIDKNR